MAAQCTVVDSLLVDWCNLPFEPSLKTVAVVQVVVVVLGNSCVCLFACVYFTSHFNGNWAQ